jgi:hypothetical protein
MERSAILQAPWMVPIDPGRKFNNEKIDFGVEIISASMIRRRDQIVRC